MKDINDVPPRFDKAVGVYEVQVPEDKGVGKNTGIVLKVIDPDVGKSSTLFIFFSCFSFYIGKGGWPSAKK